MYRIVSSNPHAVWVSYCGTAYFVNASTNETASCVWHLCPSCSPHQCPCMWQWQGDGKQEVKKMGSSLVVSLARTDRKAINTSALAAVFTLSIHSRVLLGEWCWSHTYLFPSRRSALLSGSSLPQQEVTVLGSSRHPFLELCWWQELAFVWSF